MSKAIPASGEIKSEETMKAEASKSDKAEASSGGASAGRLSRWKLRGVAILDFVLRIIGIGGTLAAAIAMGTTDETLPFFTQFFQFEAKFDDMPSFTFFVIANAVAGGYLLLSLPFSIFHIVRPRMTGFTLFLAILDTVMGQVETAGASSAAAIVYLAHKGNARANWFAICQQFESFCGRVSGALIASFVASLTLIFLVVISASTLYRR